MTLVVECKADEALVRALGVARGDIEHFLGKGRVCNRLARISGAVGMMDEDPGVTVPSYVQRLSEIRDQCSVRMLNDNERSNLIIVLRPRLEEWLVNSARESGVKLTDFGFGSDQGLKLHSEINGRLASLSRLVSTLIEKGNDRLLYLRSHLVHK